MFEIFFYLTSAIRSFYMRTMIISYSGILVNSSLATATARVSLYLSTDLESGVSEVVEAGALQRDEVPAVARQADQGGVSQVDAVGDAEIPSHRNRESLEKCIA